jgi:hypothetical protein
LQLLSLEFLGVGNKPLRPGPLQDDHLATSPGDQDTTILALKIGEMGHFRKSLLPDGGGRELYPG